MLAPPDVVEIMQPPTTRRATCAPRAKGVGDHVMPPAAVKYVANRLDDIACSHAARSEVDRAATPR